MSYSKKRMLGRATEWARRDARNYRDSDIQNLEELKEELDLHSEDIDEMLDKPKSWYTNRVNGASGSHEFDLQDFERVRTILGQESGQEFTIEDPEERANQKIERLQELQEALDIDSSTIDDALNMKSGWFDKVIETKKIPLLSYYKVMIFLEAIAVIYTEEKWIKEDQKNKLIENQFITDQVAGIA